MNHTPGPWAYTWNGDSPNYNDGHVYTQNGTLGIAIVEGSNWGAWRDAEDGGEAEFKANARLIAAAPDLFEACAGVWAALADTDDPRLAAIAKECDAALTKARLR